VSLPFHVNGGVDGGLLGSIVGSVSGEDTNGVAEAGGQGKCGGIGGISKMILSNDGRRLPTETSWEDFRNRYLSGGNESLGQAGRRRYEGGILDGRLERIGLGMGGVVKFPLGIGRFGILFCLFVLRAVGRSNRRELTGGVNATQVGQQRATGYGGDHASWLVLAACVPNKTAKRSTGTGRKVMGKIERSTQDKKRNKTHKTSRSNREVSPIDVAQKKYMPEHEE